MVVCRLNAEYQAEQERQEQKRIDDVKAREAKSRAKFEVQPIPLPDIALSICVSCIGHELAFLLLYVQHQVHSSIAQTGSKLQCLWHFAKDS